MKNLKKISRIFCILFLYGMSALWATEFEYEYRAVALPQDSVPRWDVKSNHPNHQNVALKNGKLVSQFQAGERQFYILGNSAESVLGEGDAWDTNAGLATIEFRLRCRSENPELEIFRMEIRNGERSFAFIFQSGSMNNHPVDTSEFDTYRVVLEEGKVWVASASQGMIADKLTGATSRAENSRVILFGTYDSNEASNLAGASGEWELEFIRWTNREAEKHIPDAKALTQTQTSTP